MISELERNERHYPIRPLKPPTNNNVIALPPSTLNATNIAATDDGWESLDDNNNSKIIYSTGGDKVIIDDTGYTQDLDDQNDWGGLINKDTILGELNTRAEITRQINDLKQDKSVIHSNADYTHYLTNPNISKYEWIINGVIAVGGHPIYYSLEENLDYLRKVKIKAIVSAFEEPINDKYLTGFDYYFAPTIDGYTGDLSGICEFIEKMEDENKPVFIHCFDGIERAGTIMSAYFTYKRWLLVDEAIAYVNQIRPGSAGTEYQQLALKRFACRL